MDKIKTTGMIQYVIDNEPGYKVYSCGKFEWMYS